MRAEPDLGLRLADLLQFGAAGEVEQVRPASGPTAFAVGLGDGPVENESDGFQPGLGEFVGILERSDPRNLLDRHEGSRIHPTFYHFNHKR